jgi:GAF domain-containing protein
VNDLSNELATPQRLQQLQLRRILDTPREEEFDRITRLAARATSSPIALLTFVDDRRQWFKSSFGLNEPWATRRETPLSHSLCQYVVVNRKVVAIPDTRLDRLMRDNLAVPELGVVAYLGAPLIDSEGSALGSLAVIDTKPRAWRPDEISIVEDCAQIAILEVQRRVAIDRKQ